MTPDRLLTALDRRGIRPEILDVRGPVTATVDGRVYLIRIGREPDRAWLVSNPEEKQEDAQPWDSWTSSRAVAAHRAAATEVD